MSITYRPARAADLVRSDQLVVASINELTQRHDFGPMAASSPPAFQLFSLRDDADGLWVAKEADEILGFAWSWTCGDLWFLAQLFVSPDHQGRSIGNEVVGRRRKCHWFQRPGQRIRYQTTTQTRRQGLTALTLQDELTFLTP